MPDTCNWIHLSDLHFGLDKEKWLWPRFKHILFADLKKLTDEVDQWDLVFFTGDLTQTGAKEEFELLNRELTELWALLEKNKKAPQLCVIPGNHDLVRPDPKAPVSKALKLLWSQDSGVRQEFWQNAASDYRTTIQEAFRNYIDWHSKCPVPLLPATAGIIPGDFLGVFEKGPYRIGIAGLNSTFLQLESGDYKGTLDLHVSQLNQPCGGDITKWINSHTISILLTHQPPSWLSEQSLGHFKQEIYPPGRFFAQYCGHQHYPEALEVSEVGAAPRRIRQAPALFGLEKVAEENIDRIHGYSAGQFQFDKGKGHEKLWPRSAITALHGGMRLGPDQRYELLEDAFIISRFDIRAEPTALPGRHPEEEDDAVQVGGGDAIEASMFQERPKEEASKARLVGCARMRAKFTPQHEVIRKEEQSQLDFELRKSRATWLIADWGTGSEGFLGICFERLKLPDTVSDIFHLNCDEASNIDSFESLFTQQFGMSLQMFCHHITALKNAFVVLDDIPVQLSQGENLTRLEHIISVVLDYAPSLKIILVTRKKMDESHYPTVELKPLDIPDVRLYIQNHPDSSIELEDPDVVYRIHERTDGLPLHLDRILKALRFSSLDSVLEAEWDATGSNGTESEVPSALANDVRGLAGSEDRRSKRSYRLLKVLSLLPYGETIDALRHYLPAEPFFIENAQELHDARLLEILPLKAVLPSTEAGKSKVIEQAGPKVLKVPRQVRDYVRSLTSAKEREELINAGAENYFGPRWRAGKIKLRAQPLEYKEYLNSGPGNEYAVIHDLIVTAKAAGKPQDVKKAFKLGLYYCESLRGADRFKDIAIVAGELTQLLTQSDGPAHWTELAITFGYSLRMTDKSEAALPYLNEALVVGEEHLPNSEKAFVYVEIALNEESLNNTEAAVAAARKAMGLSKENSSTHLHALAIVQNATLEGEEARRAKTKLYDKAKQLGFRTLANTLALSLSDDTDNEDEKEKLLDDVLNQRSSDLYNKMQAIVTKFEDLAGRGDRSQADLILLWRAYGYLYSQRFGNLFDRCHTCLWKELEKKGNIEQMIRLFRHTSFVWRIRGDEKKESRYLDMLVKKDPPALENAPQRGIISELRYFWNRVTRIGKAK